MESVDVRRVSRIRDSSHENATKYVSWKSSRCEMKEVIAGVMTIELIENEDASFHWCCVLSVTHRIQPTQHNHTSRLISIPFRLFICYFHRHDLQVEWECCHELFSSFGYSKGLRREMTSARDVIGIYSLMCAWGITLHAHWCGCLQTWIFIVWAWISLAFDLFRVSRSPIPVWRSPALNNRGQLQPSRFMNR